MAAGRTRVFRDKIHLSISWVVAPARKSRRRLMFVRGGAAKTFVASPRQKSRASLPAVIEPQIATAVFVAPCSGELRESAFNPIAAHAHTAIVVALPYDNRGLSSNTKFSKNGTTVHMYINRSRCQKQVAGEDFF